MQDNFHTSVLLKEAVDNLKVRSGKKYIDATVGGGGHSEAIIDQGGRVLGLDADPDALEYLSSKGLENITLKQGNFAKIKEIAQKAGFGKVSGVLFDLGMSSYHLEGSGRGFSFKKEEPLDMRMDPSLQVTAADLVNGLRRKELNELFTKYGEESMAGLFSSAIIDARKEKKIETAKELADLIKEAYREKKKGYSRIHPATRVFQALRIAVNDEINSLKKGLDGAVDLLETGGRLVVISFHSLEDRVAKKLKENGKVKPVGGLIRPTSKEIENNPRASSAKMRVFEKI